MRINFILCIDVRAGIEKSIIHVYVTGILHNQAFLRKTYAFEKQRHFTLPDYSKGLAFKSFFTRTES